MRSFLCLPLIALLMASPLARAQCEGLLNMREYYNKTARIFTILSVAMMPVQDSRIPDPPPVTIEQVEVQTEAWQAPSLHAVVQREFVRIQQSLRIERSKADPDQVLIVELEQDLADLQQGFPWLK